MSLRTTLTAALFTGLLCPLAMPAEAEAFCGFYVSTNDAPLYNDATQVVMMRDGTRTALSMRNTYQGPTEDFAMVVPVPVVLQESDVKTLDDATFDRLNNFTQPRLVEYYEKNPCENARSKRFDMMPMSAMVEESTSEGGAAPAVMVEAEFAVGEYEVVILSAKESTALESWLLTNKYNIPKGGQEVLQSYIAQGMYFFVAKVNADKVNFDAEGRALLSPLRFAYDSEDFALPVRLGLLNASGPQDLLVHIISREGRFRVSNGDNITIPTNLIVDQSVKGRQAEFYEKLFTRVHEENPSAIVTEYAWGGPGVSGQTWTPPSKCDPCTEPISEPWAKELLGFGADLLEAPAANAQTGVMSASATTMAIEAQVNEPDVQAPDPSQPDTTGAPREVATYDLGHVQGVMMEQTAKLGTCYEELSRNYGPQPEIIDVRLSIKPDGSLSSVASPESGDQWRTRVTQLANCTGMNNLVFTAPEGGASVDALVRLQFDVSYVDQSWLDISAWTVTRMHARYTADQLENDLYFTAAPPIMGGRGTPEGTDPSLPTTASAASVNNFQARYMILYPYTKWHMCLNPEPGDWRGSGARGVAPPIGALEMDEEQDFSVMQVVKNKRNWLKKKRKQKSSGK